MLKHKTENWIFGEEIAIPDGFMDFWWQYFNSWFKPSINVIRYYYYFYEIAICKINHMIQPTALYQSTNKMNQDWIPLNNNSVHITKIIILNCFVSIIYSGIRIYRIYWSESLLTFPSRQPCTCVNKGLTWCHILTVPTTIIHSRFFR